MQKIYLRDIGVFMLATVIDKKVTKTKTSFLLLKIQRTYWYNDFFCHNYNK